MGRFGRGRPPADDDTHADVAASGRHGAWRHRQSAHVAALQAELDRIREGELSPARERLADKAQTILDAARCAAADRSPLFGSGTHKDRVQASVNEAELLLLQLAPAEDLAWRGAAVLAKGVQHLGESDPRLKLLTEHLRRNRYTLSPAFRELAVGVLHAANHAQQDEVARVRSFRNVIAYAFVATLVIAAGLVWSGYLHPDGLPAKLCFEPPDPRDPARTRHVCPTGQRADGGDALLVAALGTCAATLAGAVSLRTLQGTVTGYLVPLGLLVLRLPVGALAALLGLVLIRGEFVPGFSQVDSSAQIAAWAVLFGIAQEGLTRMIDRQGQAVLHNVRGPWRSFDSGAARLENIPRLPTAPAEPPPPGRPTDEPDGG